MTMKQHLTKYGAQNPDHLLDTLLAQLGLKNDAALCRFLELSPPQISKIRHKRLIVSPAMLLVLHEKTGKSIQELRDLLYPAAEPAAA